MTVADVLRELAQTGWFFTLAYQTTTPVIWPSRKGSLSKQEVSHKLGPIRDEVIALLRALEAEDDRLLTFCGYPPEGQFDLAQWQRAEQRWREVVSQRERINRAWASYDVDGLRAIVDGIVSEGPAVWMPSADEMRAMFAKRLSHEARILLRLHQAGSKGLTNHDLQDLIGKGARHSARLHDLKSKGWILEGRPVGPSTHWWRLVGRRGELNAEAA